MDGGKTKPPLLLLTIVEWNIIFEWKSFLLKHKIELCSGWISQINEYYNMMRMSLILAYLSYTQCSILLKCITVITVVISSICVLLKYIHADERDEKERERQIESMELNEIASQQKTCVNCVNLHFSTQSAAFSSTHFSFDECAMWSNGMEWKGKRTKRKSTDNTHTHTPTR